MINESALQFVSQPYIQNLVTKESCVAYIEETAKWNQYMRIISLVAVVLMFYYMYKQGKFNKEKGLLQKLGGEDGIGNDAHYPNDNDGTTPGGSVREATGNDEGTEKH